MNSKDNPPNILVILSDQQSLDTMSCVIGDKYIKTPALDSIAENGTLFTKAYCSNPLCIPSRSSMFTGRYPHETGVISNMEIKLDYNTFTCIGKHFQKYGYDTGYTGKWHIGIPDADKRILPEDTDKHGFEFCENGRCNGADLLNAEMAEKFLTQKRTKPFFLVVSFNNPHNICEWARGKRGTELPDGTIENPPQLAELPPLRKNHTPTKDEADSIALARRSFQKSSSFPVGNFTEKDWREYIWAYYRMIESIDQKIGEVLNCLEKNNLKENTVIIFASDHGDCQGAHNWNQKTVFYDESSRVPFIISTLDRGKNTCNKLVNTGVDFAPTIFNLAGIKIPEEFKGIDVLNDGLDNRKYITCSNKLMQGAEIDGEIPVIEGRMVRSEHFKYCVYDTCEHNEELYDMENDPLETLNLARDEKYAAILKEHREYLTDFCREKNDYFIEKKLNNRCLF